MWAKLKQYDIFISYVVEDREKVDILCHELEKKKLRVWYAKQQLQAGANITTVIKEGLKNVRYGVLIISPNYKGYWSDVETFVLLDNKDRLIPILHEKTIEEAIQEMPFLQPIWCITTNEGIDKVVQDIYKRVKPKNKIYYAVANALAYIKQNKIKAAYLLLSILIIAAIFIGFAYYFSLRPSKHTINNIINQRLNTIETLVKKEFEESLAQHECTIGTLKEIERLTPTSGSRRFFFSNGIDNIQSLTGLKNQGIVPSIEPITPPFGLADYKTYLFNNKQDNTSGVIYALVNLSPHQYKITDSRLENDIYEVDVRYNNPIRYIEVYIDTYGRPHSNITLVGTKPKETFVFEKNGDIWIPLSIR